MANKDSRPASRSSRALGLLGGGSVLAATASAAGVGALLATATPAGAATFTVTNLNDSGLGSLRQAILDANAAPTDDVIEFSSSVTGTITLTTGKMVITDELSIVGPGMSDLAISGGGASQIFYVYDSAHVGALAVSISGMTVTDGYDMVWGGGAIASWSADLTLTDVAITNSHTEGGMGGGLLQAFAASGQNRDSHLTLENCVISGNSAAYSGGSPAGFPGSGGGVALYISGSADISNTVIENNQADSSRTGGGLFLDQSTGSVNITSSRISGNTAANGGGIRSQRSYVASALSIDRVSVVDNASTGIGAGAVSLDHNAGANAIVSSTIADNAGSGFAAMDASTSFAHDTIVGNSGVGVSSLNRGTNIDNSLLADNGGGDLGSVADVNWSLVESPSSNIVAGGNNITATDPDLSSLMQYSPTIWVRPFTNASAAFNAGDPTFSPPPATDQTGRARVAFGRIDVGAFELQADEPITTTTTAGGQVAPAFTG